MPRPRHRTAAFFRRRASCLTAGGLLLLAGCADEPALRFADHAYYQQDQVTTRAVPAHSELARRLATHGWRFEEPDGKPPTMRMVGDRARLWFFSADGRAAAVELHGETRASAGRAAPTLAYRLNDRRMKAVPWPPEEAVRRLDLRAGAVRAGWNVLDLFVRHKTSQDDRGVLELEGFRIADRSERPHGDEGPRTLEIRDGELSMPGESRFEVAFEVADGARLGGRLRSDPDRSSDAPHEVAVRLLDEAGAEHELAAFALEPGDGARLDVDLAPWAGQPVEIGLSVGGPRDGAVLWRDARVTGGEAQDSARAPIWPSPVARSGRLGRPDVILIILDAARADAFGAYGAEHPTPAVDALAAAGTRFERAQSPSSWTGQSIPALLSGFHPDTLHTERWGDPLPDEVPHVAELMAAAGYRTVLWSQHPIYNRAESLVRGFERIRYSGRRKRTLFPPRAFLLSGQRPTFALIHLLPPHSPYLPPKPFRGAYSSDYSGRVPPKLGALGRIGRKRMLKLTAEDHAYIFDRYLENVAFADWLVGRVVKNLRASRRYEDSVVIVTSDHGEAFFEHGRFMHSRELYQEFVRIPLIVKWPDKLTGFAPAVSDPATLIDLLPTLVDGLDLAGGERGFQGRSLLPAAFDGVRLERPLYATTRGIGDVGRMPMPRWLFEQDGWRVIHDPIAARTELYAVSADPGETEDLATAHPALARLLLQRLHMQRWFNRQLLGLEPRAEAELDPETVKELKALGYL